MIDVTLQNFEAEVLQASTRTPVLLDIWAEWCGPCKQLGPVLEQLEAEYAGRFTLAKLDADKVPEIAGQLSQMLGTRSIPLCVMFVGGQPVDGFVGAQPPAQIRAFLDKHVPTEGALAAEEEVSEAEALVAAGDTEAALAKLADALAADPANDDARADYVRLAVATGGYEEAAAALDEPLAREPRPLRFDALRRWLDAMEFVEQSERGNWPLPQFDELIAQNKRDFDTRFQKAQVLMAEGQWPQAMDELLEIIMRDRKWNDEAARKTYVAILELLTPPPTKAAAADGKSAGGIELTGKAAQQEDPQAELLSSYRRKLSMALN
ncbi:tetratricopeptide repeat protein [Ottowia testudinis]|uniref:Tetratricopeptide repeat protein n=1 Tax=Ottowia testudinis TaxID=2816950 RepID=A0A975CGK0_9BURK|nr:tetratricopeptide repeat protein [Ottowia testudinis]QTD45387.1 tetratricopeptide repeat protein [Ottowia testudinis]